MGKADPGPSSSQRPGALRTETFPVRGSRKRWVEVRTEETGLNVRSRSGAPFGGGWIQLELAQVESEGERMLEPLVITVSDVGATTTVRIAGEVDVATSQQIDEVLTRCDRVSVCVDLSGVTFMDSSGLAVLARAHERAKQRDSELTIANATPNVRRLFAITGLEDLLGCEHVGTS